MEKLITLKEAAELLGCAPATLRKWVQAKKVPHYRLSGRPKFKVSELENFVRIMKVERRPSLKRSSVRRVG